jgi:multidrug efflux pump
MVITEFALKHRTTTFVLAFLIIVVGMVSYLNMPREGAPDIKIPTIMVIVPYPGVSPEDVESLVTNQLEAEFEDLRDLDELKSTSSEGMSLVYVTFLPDTDITDASQRVRDRVNRALPKIPADVQEPVVQEITSSDWPILQINISGDAGLLRLKRVAENLEREIEAMEGVIEVDLSGGVEREIRVEVNPNLLNAYKITYTDIINALSMENINIPGGPVEEGDIRYTLRIPEEFKDPDEIRDIVITTKFGHPIRIREVAEVVDDFKERTTMSRYRGKEGVSLTVKKESGANIIDIVDGIKELLEKRQATFPAGTKVTYLNDFSKYIRERVHELENNIITALILVVLVLFLFIGGRNAFFVALAVPFSMLVSFAVLNAMGVTLNMVVLFALILALGMLVDNAIVIVENIYRHTRSGKGLWLSALEGTKEVGWPVITSTLTTVSVFFPLLAWPGIMGEFMSYLPLTLIVTLTSSLFVALVINPVLAATFMKPDTSESVLDEAGTTDEPTGKTTRRMHVKAFFVSAYLQFLRWSLRHRTIVLVGVAGLLALSIAAFKWSEPQVEFFPSTTPDRGRLSIRAAEGTALHATNKVSLAIEEFLQDKENIKNFLADVGVGGGRMAAQSSEGTPYLGNISFDFLDREEWLESPLVTIESIRQFIAGVPGAKIRVEKEMMGPPTGAPVNIEISGIDFEVLAEASEEVQEIIKDIKGLTDLRDDFSEGRPELQLDFIRALSNQLILHNLRVVAGTVRTAIYGTKATTYRLGEEEFDVTVRVQDRFRDNREDVSDLVIPGKEGRQIPLSTVTRLRGDVGATSIRHVDRRRVVTVSADAEGRPGAEVLKEARERLSSYHKRGVKLSYTGENKEMVKARSFLAQALVIGVFLIAMVLLTQFNSIGQASIILFSVLLSMIGVFWGLIVNRMPFSVMMTGVGIISLAGVVVNNAIVLIDFINKQREEGKNLTDAVVQAGVVRLRPVLLTAGTTILGLLPMAQGFDLDIMKMKVQTGTGSMEFWGPMAISVIYGLSFATVLTLVIVPVMYHVIASGREHLFSLMERRPLLRRAALLVGLAGAGALAVALVRGITGMNG